MNTICLQSGVNYFGDTVLTFPNGNSYNMFQYSCAGAKEALKQVDAIIAKGKTVLIVEDNDFNINIISAKKYITQLINIDNEVAEIMASTNAGFNNSAGAEIAGHYGY
jgi:hypothetical protein